MRERRQEQATEIAAPVRTARGMVSDYLAAWRNMPENSRAIRILINAGNISLSVVLERKGDQLAATDTEGSKFTYMQLYDLLVELVLTDLHAAIRMEFGIIPEQKAESIQADTRKTMGRNGRWKTRADGTSTTATKQHTEAKRTALVDAVKKDLEKADKPRTSSNRESERATSKPKSEPSPLLDLERWRASRPSPVNSSPEWWPKFGLTVEHYNATLHRLISDVVSAQRFAELWRQELLAFQKNGARKPSYYPTPVFGENGEVEKWVPGQST